MHGLQNKRIAMKEREPGAVYKQRARLRHVYQRAKANEMAMRTLLPNETAIEHPTFNVCEESLFPSPPSSLLSGAHHSKVLPPLVQPCFKLPSLPQATNTTLPSLAHAADSVDSKAPVEKKNYVMLSKMNGTNVSKTISHPLSKSVTADRGTAYQESIATTSTKSSSTTSKPVCLPLTMSELLKTTPIKVYKVTVTCAITGCLES